MRLLATGDGHRQHHHGQRCGQRAAGPRPVEMTGRGAGLSDEGLRRKVAPSSGLWPSAAPTDDPLTFWQRWAADIAGMCGAGGAACRACAGGSASSAPWRRFSWRCGGLAAAKAVLASHVSAEPAGMLLLDALRKTAHHGGHAPGRGHGSGGGHAAAGYGPRRIYGLLHV